MLKEKRIYTLEDKKEFPIITGIYLLGFLNSTSGNFCIGYASRNKSDIPSGLGFRNRWNKHIYELKSGRHENIKITRAAKKYGLKNIFFQIVEEVEPSRCEEREVYYIQYYNSHKTGYNILLHSFSRLGSLHTDIAKQKMTQSHLQRWDSLGTTFYQYALNGEFIKEWNNQTRCAKILGLHQTAIGQVLIGNNVTCGGFYFSYKIMDKEKVRAFINQEEDKRRERRKQTGAMATQTKMIKNIIQLDLNGKHIKTWENSKEIVGAYGINGGRAIRSVIQGKTKTYQGFKWKVNSNQNNLKPV